MVSVGKGSVSWGSGVLVVRVSAGMPPRREAFAQISILREWVRGDTKGNAVSVGDRRASRY
jgi:fructose 1,6-bisphosphatase